MVIILYSGWCPHNNLVLLSQLIITDSRYPLQLKLIRFGGGIFTILLWHFLKIHSLICYVKQALVFGNSLLLPRIVICHAVNN